MKQHQLKFLGRLSFGYGLFCAVIGVNTLLGLGIFIIAFDLASAWSLNCELGLGLFPLALLPAFLFLKGAKNIKSEKPDWKKAIAIGSISMIFISIINIFLKVYTEPFLGATDPLFSMITGVLFSGLVCAIPIYILMKIRNVRDVNDDV